MRSVRQAIRRAIAVLAIAMAGFVLTVPADAQGPLERLLDRLRGEELEPAPAPAPAAPALRAPVQQQPRVVAAPPPAAGKDEDAMTVLVVGDFLARGVAGALEDAFAERADVVVVDRTNGSSGLVRDDFYDWGAVLPDLIEEVAPGFIVMMIGTNDRQDVSTTAGRFDLRSEDWDAVYADRIAAVVETMALFGTRAIWVGQPPMRSPAMSADMAFFNGLIEDAAARYGITYLDIWDAFADQEGRFTTTGPDVDGQTRTLRADDGFSFTAAGREKIAFFVENEIGLVGEEGGFVLVPDAGGIEIEDGVVSVVGPVLVLGSPRTGARPDLLTEPPAIADDTLLDAFFIHGEPLPHVPGRADDFTWPKLDAETEPEIADEPEIPDASDERGVVPPEAG